MEDGLLDTWRLLISLNVSTDARSDDVRVSGARRFEVCKQEDGI